MTGPERLDALDAKLASQIGDDIRVIFDHEYLFKQAREAIAALRAEIARLTAERDAALAGRVKIKPLTFGWSRDESRPNPSCWRCEGEGFFAYVLIPYDPGNDPAAGTGKWNANPNHRGRVGFETREAAMAYCEEAIRRQAASEVKRAIDKLAVWAEAVIQHITVQDAARVPEIAALIEAANVVRRQIDGWVTVSGEAYDALDAALRAIAEQEGR